MEEKKPDWTISELYGRAWEILKNNKVLWVFGTALATFSYSFNSSSNINLDDKDLEGLQKLFQNPQTQEVGNVLGTTTPNLASTLGQIFSSIPWYFYLILGLEVLLLIIAFAVISLIAQAWTEAGLLQSILSALNKQKVTIADSSQKAFSSIKSLIWLNLVPGLILTLTALVVFAILGVAIGLTSGPVQALFIFLAVIGVGALIYWLIMLFLSQIWASRKIVYEGIRGKEALFSGYKIVKKKFWSMLALGIVNTILSLIIVGIAVAFIGGLVLGGIFTGSFNNIFSASLLILGIFLAVIAILASTFISGLITAFKATAWSNAYLNIKGKYD